MRFPAYSIGCIYVLMHAKEDLLMAVGELLVWMDVSSKDQQLVNFFVLWAGMPTTTCIPLLGQWLRKRTMTHGIGSVTYYLEIYMLVQEMDGFSSVINRRAF